MKKTIISLVLFIFSSQTALAAEVVDIAFPVQGKATYSNDYESPRSGGRIHHATDLIAPKMTPILATEDGTIIHAPMAQPSYGYTLKLRGDSGYSYTYIHINNDTPGTDDGLGGPENAYAPGIERGVRVKRGQHIAWVGDSGNAESVGSHLHFEMYDQSGAVMNPYESLRAAEAGDAYVPDPETLSYDPDEELADAVSINYDLDIPETSAETLCEANSLIRTPQLSTVYYCGQNGGRYAFQNEGTFFSWYKNFNDVKFVSTEEMAAIKFRGVVTYRPGSYMIKIPSSPQIYAVSRGGILRLVPNEGIAEALYGEDWAKSVRDIQDGFCSSYDVGEPVGAD